MATISNSRDIDLQSVSPRIIFSVGTSSTTSLAFTKTKNSTTKSPASIALVASAPEFTAPIVEWEYSLPSTPNTWNSAGTGITSGTAPTKISTLTVTSGTFTTQVSTATKVLYRARINQATYPELISPTITIDYVAPADDIPVINFSRESVGLPTTLADVVTYTNSGASIGVTVGGSGIPYHDTNPSSFSVSAAALGIVVDPTPSGTVTRVYDDASSMTGGLTSTATITYTITIRDSFGVASTHTKIQTFNKLYGTSGTRTAVLDMYQSSSSVPTTFPVGSSMYTWATAQFTAPATLNGWSLTPTTPTVGQTLYIARTVYADSLATTTTSVTWTAATAIAIGAAGSNGQRVGILEVYQWALSAPTSYPSGTSTYTWATGAFTAPSTANGWSLLPGASTPGHTLWGISVRVSNSLTTADSTVTWNSTSVYAVGAAGTNGTNGGPGGVGPTGTRGTRQLYDTNAAVGAAGYNSLTLYVYGANAAGSASYSARATDLIAAATVGDTPTTPIKGDSVTMTNGSTFTNSLTYNGSAWVFPGTVIDGNLLVTGSIEGTKLSATSIDGKTITGANIQTSATGRRVLLDATGFRAYNTAETLTTQIGTATYHLYINDAANNVALASFFNTGSTYANGVYAEVSGANSKAINAVVSNTGAVSTTIALRASENGSGVGIALDVTGQTNINTNSKAFNLTTPLVSSSSSNPLSVVTSIAQPLKIVSATSETAHLQWLSTLTNRTWSARVDANTVTQVSNWYLQFTTFAGDTQYGGASTKTALTISGAGDITAYGNVTAYSDINIKKEIVPIKEAVSIVQALGGYRYLNTLTNKYDYGVIAQEVEKVLPELIGTSGKYKTVSYNGIIALLVESVKALNAKIEKLEGNR